MSNKSGPGFHHVAFRSYDFEKTLNFYKEAFGLSVHYSWGEAPKRAAMLDVGSGDYVEVFEGGNPPGVAPEGVLMHFALRVPSCDEAFKKAVDGGASVQMEPADVPIKGTPEVVVRIAFVKGPDNEVIELFQNDYL